MDFILWSAILVAALAVLIKGADVFVDQAARIATVLGVSHALVGVTLVALGTSLPELAASIFSVVQGSGEFVAGTVYGSNVANLCLIMGTAALAFKGFKVNGQLIALDLPVLILAALVLGLISLDHQVSLVEGLFLLAMYVLYLAHCAHQSLNDDIEGEGRLRPKHLVLLVLGGVAIYFGAQYTVKAVQRLSILLGFADTSVLALSVVAVGSSLPELVVTLSAARKRYYDMSLGNVVGSNICNSFLVMGVPAMIQPLPVSQAVFTTGLPYMIAASLVFLPLAAQGQVRRTSGLFLLLLFGLFLATLFGLA